MQIPIYYCIIFRLQKHDKNKFQKVLKIQRLQANKVLDLKVITYKLWI